MSSLAREIQFTTPKWRLEAQAVSPHPMSGGNHLTVALLAVNHWLSCFRPVGYTATKPVTLSTMVVAQLAVHQWWAVVSKVDNAVALVGAEKLRLILNCLAINSCDSHPRLRLA